MRSQDLQLTKQLSEALREFDQNSHPLPGLISPTHLDCLVAQIIDSIRRIKYVEVIRKKQLSNIYIDPSNRYFDPIKAASWCNQNGYIDEAFWLVFIATHFGKNKKSGWNLPRAVYAGTGSGGIWTWDRIKNNFHFFRDWLHQNLQQIKSTGSFGNHRKYQSLDAFSTTGTGMAIGSYIEWVGPSLNHQTLIQNVATEAGNDPKLIFDILYKKMDEVISFGRTAKFDYLTMIGKLNLAQIEPGFTYIEQATGPKRGAKLLFGGSINARINDVEINNLISDLDRHLGLYFGMQVIEDSLCNWQKNPSSYTHFKG